MYKLMSATTLALLLLGACSNRPAPESSDAVSARSSRSGIEFYGTLDVGVGSSKLSH